MGILDLVLGAILLIAFIIGLQKGLLASFLSLLAMIGASLTAASLYPALSSRFDRTKLIREWLPANVEKGADISNLSAVLGYLVAFLLSWAALMLVVNLINNVFRLPKLRFGDGLFGGVIGLVCGYMMVCLLMASVMLILTPFFGMDDNQIISTLIDESALGKFFTGDNPLADLFGIGEKIANIR